MFFQSERRGLEGIHSVASRTLSAAREVGELAAMGIWLVTVGTLLKRHWLSEVPMRMALHALNVFVLAEQSKPGLGMVEGPIQPGHQEFFPACCGMARLARLRKTAAVRIGVAIVAIVKSDARIARLVVAILSVAALAGNFGVQSGQGITRQRVIEGDDVDRLPLDEVVTLKAIRAQSPLMLISMTGRTRRRNSEKCFVQILDADRCTCAFWNVFWRVAPAANERGVSALKLVSSLVVGESLDVPFRQNEIFAVVFGMAVDAFLTRARLDVVSRV